MHKRQFKQNDLQEVISLTKKILEEFGESFSPYDLDKDIPHIDERYTLRGGKFLVVVDQKKIIGTIGFVPINEKTCKLRRFYLLKEYRGKGRGTKIFNEFLNYIKKKGYEEIWLSTTPQFKEAIKFYTKNGFKKSRKPLWPFKRAPLFYTFKITKKERK